MSCTDIMAYCTVTDTNGLPGPGWVQRQSFTRKSYIVQKSLLGVTGGQHLVVALATARTAAASSEAHFSLTKWKC